MTRKRKLIKTTALLSLFLALSILLNYLESFLPASFIPGVKLGLANTMGLIVLYFFGKKEYFLLGFFRVLIVSILFTGLFSYGFFLSLSGWFLSSIICIILVKFKKLSIYSLSSISAITHGIGQILCACILYKSIYMLSYIPILLFTGVVTGLLIAFISQLIINRVKPYIYRMLNINNAVAKENNLKISDGKNNNKSEKKKEKNRVKINLIIYIK